MWLLNNSEESYSAFFTGWWFGFGFFSTGLYWVIYAFLVDSERFAWLIPLSLFALSASLALFTGLATWLTVVTSLSGLQRGVALAGAWTISEIARGKIFGGFPWNLIAYVWTDIDAMMQPAAVIGSYGMSLLTVLIASLPISLLKKTDKSAHSFTMEIKVIVVMLLTLWFAGETRLTLAGPKEMLPMVAGVKLRLVQPNIRQSTRWIPELRSKHFLQHVDMSLAPGFNTVTHVIWPETASSFSLDWNEEARNLVARAAPVGGAVLTGVMRMSLPEIKPTQFWNSLMVISHEGTVVTSYDKTHLVPFGEYMPLRNLFPFARAIVGSTDFSFGSGIQTLKIPGIPPVSPLICYEIIFPGAVTERAFIRPRWMLNLTNDAWFGLSAGPYQHFASARWRAIEEGIPLVRASVTGISGIIDPYGRVVESLSLGTAGVLDIPLPNAVAEAPPFSKFGNTLAFAIAITCLGVTSFFKFSKFSPGKSESQNRS